MARRRGKKDPRGAEVVFGIVVMLVALSFIGGSGGSGGAFGVFIDRMFGALLWLAAGVAVLCFAIWFIKGIVKPTKPLDFDKRTAAKTGKNNVIPTQWSKELISDIEWRVFEKLCFGLWRAKGFEIEESGNGADGGVDFYLRAPASGTRIGAIQCKSWKTKQIDVKVVRELQGVVASEPLQLGLLMYSGVLTKAAQDFIAKPGVTVKAQGADEILVQIEKLPEQVKNSLLQEITSGDYLTPSCPNCDVKLVQRIARKTGSSFMACPNFPRCRYTLNSK